MSYILDALKKSEQERERERGSIPGIASVHAAAVVEREKTTTVLWLYVLLGLMLVGGGAGAYFFLYPLKESPVVVAEVSEPVRQNIVEKLVPSDPPVEIAASASTPAPTPASKTVPGTVNSGSGAAQIKADIPQKPPPKVVFSKEYLQADDTVPRVGNPRVANDGATEKSGSSVTSQAKHDLAMPISELPDDIRKKIPVISFAGHVYSSTKKRSSVMINGRKMREGESVNAELTLVSITPSGAEFKFKGYLFILDALQDWSY